MAPGFCTCERDFPQRITFHPPAGASWHYLCDKPVLAYALGPLSCAVVHGPEGCPGYPDDPPEYVPGDGEAQRIAEVYADARAEQDRGL